jgi:hypothetical protein
MNMLELIGSPTKKVLVALPIALRKAIKLRAREKKILVRDLIALYLCRGLLSEEESSSQFKKNK